VVDEDFIPGNTQVSVTPITLQRDARYYTRPLEFLPERWIDAERPANWNHDTRAFIPFTVGQFTCLGKNLAYQELRLFLGTVAKNFDIAYAPGENFEKYEGQIKYKGTLLLGPLNLVLNPRK
jgi:cytochrome P450